MEARFTSFEEIGKLLEKFVRPFSAAAALYDANMNLRYSSKIPKLCSILKEKVPTLCGEDLKDRFEKAKKVKRPFISKCFIGKLLFNVPIFKGGKFFAFGTGCVSLTNLTDRERKILAEVAQLAGIEKDKLLEYAEEDFLYGCYPLPENAYRSVYIRDIKDTAALIRALERYLRAVFVRFELEKLQAVDRYADIVRAIENIIAGDYSKIPKSEKPEVNVVLMDVSLALDTCKEVLKSALSESMKWKAYHDSLTGVYNRHVLKEELERIKTLRIAPVAFLLVDIDDLKKVNDTFGHDVGDKVIYLVAKAIKSATRRNDSVIRLGGDEFLVILPGVTKDKAPRILERIKENIEKLNEVLDLPLRVSVSMGVSVIEKPTDTPEVAIKEADRDMYRRKFKKK